MSALVLVFSIMAAAGASGAVPQGVSQLTLTVEVDRDVTVVHSPFQVWFTLTNASGEATEGPFDLNVERSGAVVEFGRAGGPLSPLTFLDQRTVRSPDGDPNKTLYQSLNGPRVGRLERGEAMRGSVILGFDPYRKTFLLESEGEYELRVRTIDPLARAWLASNTLRIVVRPPGPTDRAGAEAFVPALALLAQGSLSGSDVEDGVLQDAGAFLERFPAADHAYLLRSALRRELAGRRGASEVALAARLAEQDRLSPPVPPGGLERAAHDALSHELELIIHYGEYGRSAEARNLSVRAYTAALEYAERFSGTTYARWVRFKLENILRGKQLTKRITNEEEAILRRLSQ